MENIYSKNIDYYERNAKKYENTSWYFFNKYKDRTLLKELKQCLKYIKKDHLTILEIGPGTGYIISKLLKIKGISFNYTCIEHSSEMRSILFNRYKNKVKNFEIYIDSVSADYIATRFTGRKFDFIIGSSILHHLPDYNNVIKELSCLLNYHGVLYFVREPIHKNECQDPKEWQIIINRIYESINSLLLKPSIKKVFWPKKEKQEDTSQIAIHMFKQGVSLKPFYDLCMGDFKIIILRKYNRRVSGFFSYIENKWFKISRIDIFRNTLFAVGIQKNK